MTTSWSFHADSGLTMPFTTRVTTIANGLGPNDSVVYFGSSLPGRTLQAAVGTADDPIVIEVDDSLASGVTAAAIKLALSLAGLDSAVAGASLVLPPVLLSGAANRVAIFVRTSQGILTDAFYSGLRLRSGPVVES